mgnify:CR=1 FL=1
MNTRPLTDSDVLGALAGWSGGAMTYVIANVLCRKWSTAQVRRRLQDMERRGIVRRGPTSYAVQICWQTVPA